jgi:outer membrane protein assembly factor BamB
VDPTAGTWLGTRLASYRVDELIGRGGMGEVYRAFDLRLERPVALKLLAPALSDDERFRDRMLRESRMAAGLDHPNVVPVYEAGEEGGHLFIAMRYVDGVDLKALLRKHGHMDPARIVKLVMPVADALDAAHARGLVHRDVKPSNVLVDDPGGREHPYLADFGLTLSAGHRGPADGGLMGTIDYIAPEQVRGDDVDGRADQYALTCLIFECLTGTLPYQHKSELETIFSHLQEPPPAASARRADLPSEVDAVLAKGMAKEPSERYATCTELVDAVRAALGLEDAQRRRRRSLGIAVGIAVLLAAGLAVSLLTGTDGTADDHAGAAVRVDPSTGEIGVRHDLSGAPNAIAAGGGNVWIGSYEDGQLWRITRGDSIAAVGSPVGDPRDIAYSDGRMYVAGDGPKPTEGSVVAYDAATGSQEDGIELMACSMTSGVREGLWTSGCPNTEKLEQGPRGLRVAKTVALPFQEPLTAANLRQCQCDMSAGGGAVWILGDAADRRLWKIDATRDEVVGEVRIPFAIGRGVAVADDSVWVAGPLDDVVARVDARTLKITDTIDVGRAPTALAARGNEVWVGNWLDRTLMRIDAGTGRVVRTVELSGRPNDLAFGPGGLWVATDER